MSVRDMLESRRHDLLAAIKATDHIRSCSANNLCRDYLGKVTAALRNLDGAPATASIIAGRFGPNGYGPGIADAVSQARWWAEQYPNPIDTLARELGREAEVPVKARAAA